VKAGEINRIPEEVEPKSRPQPTNIIDLAALLKQSLVKGPKKSSKARNPRGKPPRTDGNKNCA
jgi:non-homologous end joining protein Ku